MNKAYAIIILGMNFLSMPADLIAASSKTASLLVNLFLCAKPASRKKNPVKDIIHRNAFPTGENGEWDPPLLLLEELPFFASLLHFRLQVSL